MFVARRTIELRDTQLIERRRLENAAVDK